MHKIFKKSKINPPYCVHFTENSLPSKNSSPCCRQVRCNSCSCFLGQKSPEQRRREFAFYSIYVHIYSLGIKKHNICSTLYNQRQGGQQIAITVFVSRPHVLSLIKLGGSVSKKFLSLGDLNRMTSKFQFIFLKSPTHILIKFPWIIIFCLTCTFV